MADNAKLTLIACRSCGSEGPFVPRFQVGNRYDPTTLLSIVTCARCGICFINPQYGIPTYMEFYERTYFQQLDGKSIPQIVGEVRSAYREAFFPFFRGFVEKLPRDGRYLDAGTGTGIFLDFLFEARPDLPQEQVWALEPSRATGEHIQARYPRVSIQGRLVETNEFPDAQFDNLLCSALIEHFVDPLAALLHLNRITKPGGRLMLLTPKLDEQAGRKGLNAFFKFVHTFYYTRRSLESLLAKAGFEVETCEEFRGRNATDVIWYTTLLVCARKREPRTIGDLDRVRAPAPDDRLTIAETDAVLRIVKRRHDVERTKDRVRSLLRNPLKVIARRVARAVREVRGRASQ